MRNARSDVGLCERWEVAGDEKGMLNDFGRGFLWLGRKSEGSTTLPPTQIYGNITATLRQHLELKPGKTEQNGSVATLFYQ